MTNIRNKIKSDKDFWLIMWQGMPDNIQNKLSADMDVNKWNDFWDSILIQPELKSEGKYSEHIKIF